MSDEVIDYLAQEATETDQKEPKVESKPAQVIDQDEAYLSKFSALTKKEKELLQKHNQLKQIEQEHAEFTSLKEQAKSNPLAILNKLGLSIEDLGEYMLNQEEKNKLSPEVYEMKLQLEQLKKEREEDKLQIKTQTEQQAINTFKQQIEDAVIKSDAELIQLHGATSAVYELCEEYYNQTGELLDIATAVKTVEQELEEQAELYLKANKIKNKFTSNSAPSAPGAKVKIAPEKPSFSDKVNQKEEFTLKNDLKTTKTQQTKMSKEEALAYAASFIK